MSERHNIVMKKTAIICCKDNIIMCNNKNTHYPHEQCVSIWKIQLPNIVGITEMRNHVGHGTTESQDRSSAFTGADAVEYFNFMTDLINDYIKTLE